MKLIPVLLFCLDTDIISSYKYQCSAHPYYLLMVACVDGAQKT